MIIFDAEKHIYKLKDHPEIELISASKLIDYVKQPFDESYWSEKKAKERGITKEEILLEWKEKKEKAQQKGTKYHKEYEERLIKNKKVFSIPTIDNFKHSYNLLDLTPGIYPELILYNALYKIAGMADLVEIFDDRTFTLSDHKTSMEIKFNSFKKFDPIYKDKVPVKMRTPLSHLEDANGIHYSIQLSLYAWMLEQFGFQCKSLTIHHVIFDENDEPCNITNIPIEYKKRDILTLLNWFKSTKI